MCDLMIAAVVMMQPQEQRTRYMEEESWGIIQSSVYLKATQQILREVAVRLSHKSGGHRSYQEAVEAQKLSNYNTVMAGEKIKDMEIQLATCDRAGSNQKEEEEEKEKENDDDDGGIDDGNGDGMLSHTLQSEMMQRLTYQNCLACG